MGEAAAATAVNADEAEANRVVWANGVVAAAEAAAAAATEEATETEVADGGVATARRCSRRHTHQRAQLLAGSPCRST